MTVAQPSPGVSAAPPETDTQAVKRLRRELSDIITSLEEGVKLLPVVAAQMRAHARAAHIDQPLPEARAQQAALQVTALLPQLGDPRDTPRPREPRVLEP